MNTILTKPIDIEQDKKTISVLGSTGSIGTQTLEVIRACGYKVGALAAESNTCLLETQAREFHPHIVSVMNESAAADLKVKLADTNIKVLSGMNGICEAAAHTESDIVLNAIVGIAGLRPTMAAIEANKTIALANKETLVAGGELVMSAVRKRGVSILPVDSEHSAIFQCMQGAPKSGISKIILTASGGPFFSKTIKELSTVTAKDALKHPTWSMGSKITIDSATLINKGLEVIEAVHLFDIPPDKIEVVVHRESILHSAVVYMDGAVIGQMGLPSMKLPIQYALTYPERCPCEEKGLDLISLGKMTFYEPDYDTFSALSACLSAIKSGGLKPAAANGANEAAVELFLEGKIGFLDIGELVGEAMERQTKVDSFTLDDVFAADREAREYVNSSL